MDVVRNRTLDAAASLWERLPQDQRDTVESVAMDMWEPFMTATRQTVPQADIVHDKYHTVSYLTKAVDAVRRKEHAILLKAGNDILKGTKYLWLKNPVHWGKEDRDTFRS